MTPAAFGTAEVGPFGLLLHVVPPSPPIWPSLPPNWLLLCWSLMSLTPKGAKVSDKGHRSHFFPSYIVPYGMSSVPKLYFPSLCISFPTSTKSQLLISNFQLNITPFKLNTYSLWLKQNSGLPHPSASSPSQHIASSSMLARAQTKKTKNLKSSWLSSFLIPHLMHYQLLSTSSLKQIQNQPLPATSTAELCFKNSARPLPRLPAAPSDDSVSSQLRSQRNPFKIQIRLHHCFVQNPRVVSELDPDRSKVLTTA